MAQVSASSSITLTATPEQALGALTDYETMRPRILPQQYRDYQVLEGGQGDGTIAQWTLQATEKRSRNVKASVTVAGNTITERDANSSLVTTWTVEPSGAGSTVTTSTEWKGAGGIGGFFERTFAPLGLRRIQEATLANLQRESWPSADGLRWRTDPKKGPVQCNQVDSPTCSSSSRRRSRCSSS